jgi:DNA-binding response OmpR family regulator
MLTDTDDAETRTLAFRVGVDDYVAKPFHAPQLLARIEAKLQRMTAGSLLSERLLCGNLDLDIPKLEARIEGKRLGLSVLELHLLHHLVLNRDRVQSREDILAAVWQDSVVTDRTVDTHIAFLRKKLRGFDHVIATVYGAGYLIREPAPSERRVPVDPEAGLPNAS